MWEFFLRNKVDINDINKVKDSLEKISIDFVIKSGIQKIFLNGKCVEDLIRKENISKKVSVISAIPEVRKFLVNIQKKMGLNKKIVVEGRDITTVVFPQAEIKNLIQEDLPFIKADKSSKSIEKKFRLPSLDLLKTQTTKEKVKL